MSVEKSVGSAPNLAVSAKPMRRRGRPPHVSAPPRAVPSVEAKRRAAAILEVLAGSRRPTEAAAALGVTVPRYYVLEERALRGLLSACEPYKTAVPSLETRLAELEKELARTKNECARQQALARVAQRTVGLAPLPVVKPSAKTAGNAAKHGKHGRKRRPTVRALKAARALAANSSGSQESVALQPQSTEGSQFVGSS